MKDKTKILPLIIVLLLVSINFSGCGKNETKNSLIQNSEVNSNETVTENTEISTENSTAVTNTTIAQANTSQKVDEIARQAKADSKSITTEIKSEAVKFIKENKSNFFKNNETMEKAMYYGYLLEYAYEKTDIEYAKLGQDVYQAIKYVYRGAEKVEDQSTQENLNQIEKDLKNIK